MNLLTRFFSNTKVKYDVMNKLIDEIEARDSDLENRKVDKTTTVNNKSLTGNITINQDDVASGTTNKAYTSTEQSKLSGVATGATKVDQSSTNGNIKINDVEKQVYAHPSTHTASMIIEDASKRFVSDTEKSTWNEKETPTGAQSKADAAVTAAKTYTDTVKTTLENSIATKTTTSLNDVATNVNFIGSYDKVDSITVDGKVLYIGQNSKILAGGKNLLNKSNVTDGKYVDYLTGQLKDNVSYVASHFIPISPNQNYCITGFNEQGAFYDINQNFISGFLHRLELTSSLSPSNAAYMRVSVKKINLDVAQVETGVVQTTYEPFIYADAIENRIPNKSLNIKKIKSSEIHVDKNGNGDFSSITEAIASINNDTLSNPVTIIVHSGIYNESVSIGGERHISLIGVNKKDCIIKTDTGLYADAPLEIQGDAYISNLTFIATHENTSAGMPITGNKAYAVHCDYVGSGTTTFFNCDLISYQSSALGAGLHQDQTLILNTCNLITYTPNDETWTTTPSYGACFVHSSATATHTNQKFLMKNCYLESSTKFNIAFGRENSDFDICLINNNFWSIVNGKSDITVKEWGTITYNNRCYGNNIAKLNK